MSSVQTLGVSLSNPKNEQKPLLFLEQKGFSPFAGKLTKAGMAAGVLSWLRADTFLEPGNACGGSKGLFIATVYAYMYRKGLNYTFDTSYGSVDERVTEDLVYLDKIQISLKDYVGLSYPNEGVVSTEWVGPVYNSKGETIPKPVFTIDKRGVTFSEKVYGYLKIRYNVSRHRYSVTVYGRNIQDVTIIEDKYSSTVYAVWDGGIDWLVVEPPYGYEAFDGECGNGVILNPPDPFPNKPPKASPSDKDINIDYCTGSIKS